MGLYFKEANNSIVFKVKLIPNSSVNELRGLYNDAVKIKVKAPPVDGKANKACCEYLAGLFKVSKSSVSVIQGKTSKIKLIKIIGVSQAILRKALKL